MTNGFLRVAAACPKLNVADVEFNVDNILRVADELFSKGVELVLFPELCITGYTCGDLFHQQALLSAASKGLRRIVDWMSSRQGRAIVVGLPRLDGDMLYNSAAFVTSEICEFVDKTFLPNSNEFYEKRWFAPSAPQSPYKIIAFNGVKFGIEICEDLWAPIPPSSFLSLNGAQVILNLSASNDLIGKYDYLRQLIRQQSARCLCGYVYSGAGFGESTTDLVFDGRGMIAENGTMLAERERWSAEEYAVMELDIDAIVRERIHSVTFADSVARYRSDSILIDSGGVSTPTEVDFALLFRKVDPKPFVPADDADRNRRCEEIVRIQTLGLARRLQFIHASKLVVGVSGGLDSTLALLVACRAFDYLHLDRKGIIGITMPGFGTTGRTYRNAVKLMEGLGITIREISISAAVTQHFSDIGHDATIHDTTYENCQARERTQILMDVANKEGAIVLGTGDLSELALGWATYNGDHMSMYGVNAGVPKTLVRDLVRWCADSTTNTAERDTLSDIIDTPISPELIPADDEGNIAQKTEDLVGPYELHDFFLYYALRYGFSPERIRMLALNAFAGSNYGESTIDHWLNVFIKRFFAQQFKRSCLPDGPKVGSVCLSPRGDWRMPSDASASAWL